MARGGGRSRSRGGGVGAALWAMYREFAANTGIHGLKYITEDGRSPVERVLWAVVVVCCVCGAGVMVATFWQRFVASPTRSTVETNHFPAWRLPFPAATLCNANRVFRSRAVELLRTTRLPAGVSEQEALSSLKLLQDIIEPLPSARPPREGRERVLRAVLGALNSSITNVVNKLGQSCGDMLERCKWEGEIVNCSTLFEERKSFIGFCCSFNYLGLRDRRLSNGSWQLDAVPGSPLHTHFYSHRMGLTVLLNPRIDDYFLSTLFSPGVRMLIHNAHDYPDETALEKLLPVGRESLLRVTASSSYCAAGVRSVAAAVRRCVFAGERRLRNFPAYSSVNCIAECRAAFLRDTCGCAPYHYPHTGEAPVCGLDDIECLREHYYALYAGRNAGAGMAEAEAEAEAGEETESELPLVGCNFSALHCDCPPLCDQVFYDVQFSSGDLGAAQFQRTTFFEGANVTDRVLFHFYVGNHVTVRTRRDIISTWNDLLSSLGGVFSLFLGCSFMSVIEVVYFFGLRLALRYRRLAAAAPDASDAAPDATPERPLPPLSAPLPTVDVGHTPLRLQRGFF